MVIPKAPAHVYERANRWVFNFLLNELSSSIFLSSSGKPFHAVGAATLKARSPKTVFICLLGNSIRLRHDAADRSVEVLLLVVAGAIRFIRYFGAVPRRVLNTSKPSL